MQFVDNILWSFDDMRYTLIKNVNLKKNSLRFIIIIFVRMKNQLILRENNKVMNYLPI